MKNFFYIFLFTFIPLIIFANELDEELIDKKFNQITCSFINEPQEVDYFSFSVMEKENNNNQCNIFFKFIF